MPVRNAQAEWQGNLKDGKGTVKLGSGTYEGAYTYASRFEEGKGTNPDELVGAALASCYSMFLASVLSKAGHTPERVDTTAKVHLGEGGISKIELHTEVAAPGLDEAGLQEHAENSKQNCPVSKALASTKMELHAKLLG